MNYPAAFLSIHETSIPARTTEVRFLVIGLIKGKHRSAIVTPRGDSIRTISVRRSRAEEVVIYESQEV
ncbi:MAG: BrnT family toxin [Burkholderiales bacterium]|nr:BrnT family toxin [Burkholderiales bacterium]